MCLDLLEILDMRIFLTCLLILCILNLASQIVVVDGNFEKKEYKLDEPVKFIIEANDRIDSVIWMDTFNFQSKKTRSISMDSKYINKEFKYQTNYIYTLIPKLSGFLVLDKIKVFVKGKEYSIPKKTITVLNEGRSEKESNYQKSKELYEKFKLSFPTMNTNQVKENTTRFLVSGELGYIEIFTNNNWRFYKALTEEEIVLLNSLKK